MGKTCKKVRRNLTQLYMLFELRTGGNMGNNGNNGKNGIF